jgi:hypothetical protein
MIAPYTPPKNDMHDSAPTPRKPAHKIVARGGLAPRELVQDLQAAADLCIPGAPMKRAKPDGDGLRAEGIQPVKLVRHMGSDTESDSEESVLSDTEPDSDDAVLSDTESDSDDAEGEI